MIWRIYFLFLLHPFGMCAQSLLNDTTFFGAEYTHFHTGIEVDSGYYVVGMALHGETYPMAEYLLGFIHKNGSKTLLLDEYDTLNSQRVAFAEGNLFFNDKGNFVSCFANCDSETCYPRLKEVSPSGQVITDVSFKSYIQSLPGFTYDRGTILQKKSDSSYMYFNNVIDSMASSANHDGVLCYHLDKNFDSLGTNFIMSPNDSRSYLPMNAIELEGGHVLLMINRRRVAGWAGINLESDVYFVELDESGNIVATNNYSDGVVNDFPYALRKCQEGGYFFTYFKGYWNDTFNGWEYENYLCHVDDDFSLVWKKQMLDLRTGLENEFFNRAIKRTLDNNYVTAGGHYQIDTNDVFYRTFQLSKFDSEGNFIWRRHHHKFNLPLDSTLQIVPVVRDVVLKADGGYAMIGAIFDYEQLNIGNRGVYGYIVETNCLGFRGAPQATASHSIEDNYTIAFYNTSTQAGGYIWHFGDGDTLSTDEYMDSVVHNYSGIGPYTVELIAVGCGNERDTLVFEVSPETEQDSNVVVDAPGGFLIYPNPVGSNEELHLYMKPVGTEGDLAYLEIIALNGTLVTRMALPATGGDFTLRHALSAGIYSLRVVHASEVRYHGKLAVE